MKRLTGLAAAALLVSALFAGCSSGTTTAEPSETATPTAEATPTLEPTQDPAESTTIRIAALKGPTTMGLVGLMADAEAGIAAEDYQVTMFGSPDEVVPLVVKGDTDVALVPSNLAAVLYDKTKAYAGPQVQVAAINTLGIMEVLESGDTINSVADLKGRTVYLSGKGASPEFVLNFILTQNGLTPGTDVDVQYKSEHTEVAALLAADPTAVGILPQPFASVVKATSPDVRTALSLSDEWAAVSPDSEMVTGVLVVNADFAEQNPEAFDQFLTDYAASTEFTNSSPAEAAPLIVAAGIVPAAPIAEAAIPGANITFIDGEEMVTALGGYLQVLFEADPASVGGSMPGDDFYYRR